MDDSEFPDSDDEFEMMSTNVSSHITPLNGISQSNSQLSNGAKTVHTSTKVSDFFPDDDEFPTEEDMVSFQESAPPPASENEGQKGRKRTFEELRRDVAELLSSGPGASADDLLHEDDFLDLDDGHVGRKDKRPRWNQPKEVIETIRHEIKRKALRHEGKGPDMMNVPRTMIERETMSLKIPSWNFVALTRTTDSRRVYIRLRPKNSVEVANFKPASGFLNVDYDKLHAEAENILIEKSKRDSLPVPQAQEVSTVTDDQLWVDKYRPRTYMELLSDETVNRTFLHWMKLWDKIVFGREPQHKRKHNRHVEKDNFGWKKFQKEEVELVDGRGFPIHKIALLSGPPGLGKTTLAHLVATHAGYNVVEINASDERGPEAFRQALLSSTQMRSLIGADPRPNCLVLDEIDGAPAASIDLLLKFVQGKLTAKGKKAKEASTKDKEYCKRPVICICNEGYTPALRSLRQMAYIINVPKVSAVNLADRLSTIARREHLTVDQGMLIQLAERSGCDIRACLGSLQYMGSDCGKSNESLGSKDMKKNIFDSWREILKVPMERAGPLPPKERALRILQITHGENTDRLTQGVFENYPTNCNEKLDKVANSLEWFQLYDTITTVVNTKQDWTVAPYTGYCFVTWHFGFAGALKPKLSYPHAASDAYQKLTKSMAILSATRKYRGQDTQTIILDIAPFIFELINPKLRSVASNLYSSKEKDDLTRLINVLLDLGISFVQEKSEDGAVDYQIEPNLFEVGTFPECKTRRGISYAVKQIVAQELELERLRRAAIAFGSSNELNSKDDAQKNDGKSEKSEKFIPAADAFRPTHLNDMERIVTVKEPKFTNFFEGFKTISKGSNAETPKEEKPGKKYRDLIANYGVWYKYKEGFSNSIRRDVMLEDIL